MRDTITCPHCGGNLSKDAHSMGDPYLCDCCGYEITADGEHIPPPRLVLNRVAQAYAWVGVLLVATIGILALLHHLHTP